MTAIMVCLYSLDEYKFCITWTLFQMGQICFKAVCVSLCVCVTWQGKPCRQLKVLINALLDNTRANPIIWQPLIRAFASLAVCLSGSLQGPDILSADCYKGEQRERSEGSLIFSLRSDQFGWKKGSCQWKKRSCKLGSIITMNRYRN